MRCGLFDALSGRFPDGDRVDEVPEHEHRIRSILGNLTRVLNARRASLAHVPDYGLPDVTDLARNTPEAVNALRDMIRDVVERFEPRLRRVQVRQDETNASSPNLVFILTGEVTTGGRIQLQTTIRPQEPIEIHTTGVPR